MRNAPIIQSAVNTSSQNLPAIYAAQLYGVSVLAVQGDASADGTVKLQASNDFAPAANLQGAFSPTNWIDVPNTSQSVSSGASVLIPFTQICYQWIRVVWTYSSGASSTITAEINVQGV